MLLSIRIRKWNSKLDRLEHLPKFSFQFQFLRHDLKRISSRYLLEMKVLLSGILITCPTPVHSWSCENWYRNRNSSPTINFISIKQMYINDILITKKHTSILKFWQLKEGDTFLVQTDIPTNMRYQLSLCFFTSFVVFGFGLYEWRKDASILIRVLITQKYMFRFFIDAGLFEIFDSGIRIILKIIKIQQKKVIIAAHLP